MGQDLRTIISFYQRRLSHIENIFRQFQNEACQTCIKRQKAGVLPGEHVVQGEVGLDLALLVDQLHNRNLGKREFRIGKMPNDCQDLGGGDGDHVPHADHPLHSVGQLLDNLDAVQALAGNILFKKRLNKGMRLQPGRNVSEGEADVEVRVSEGKAVAERQALFIV